MFKQSLPLIPTFVTTPTDAARFADALFSGEVLLPETLETMLDTEVMASLPCPEPLGGREGCPFKYGLGVFHFDLGGRHLVGHDGGSGAIVVHDQSDGLIVSILSNGGEQDLRAFIESVLDAVDPG